MCEQACTRAFVWVLATSPTVLQKSLGQKQRGEWSNLAHRALCECQLNRGTDRKVARYSTAVYSYPGWSLCGARCVMVVCVMAVAVANAATIGAFLLEWSWWGCKAVWYVVMSLLHCHNWLETHFCVNPWTKAIFIKVVLYCIPQCLIRIVCEMGWRTKFKVFKVL